MKLENAVNIEDLHRMAKRRLPKIAFDFIEGGVEDELGISRNEAAFKRYRLMPRYLVHVNKRDQSAKLFDRVYASPFGISPTGAAGLFRPGADLMLAESAAGANIPFVMSGASTASMEKAAGVAPTHTWYQLYVARDPKISEDLIRRARDAGLGTLVLTVDVPVGSKRERNIRNGFGRPLKMTWKTKLEALTHPGWLMEYMRTGTPLIENWAPYAGAGANADQVADFVAHQMPSIPTWEDLEKFRKLWPRHLVVKGILHPDDARRAADIGVDGIIVSNHGGRRPRDDYAGQRGAARRGYPDRAGAGRALRFLRASDALWRGSRWNSRGAQGDQYSAERDRSHDGADWLSEPGPARREFPVRWGWSALTHIPYYCCAPSPASRFTSESRRGWILRFAEADGLQRTEDDASNRLKVVFRRVRRYTLCRT